MGLRQLAVGDKVVRTMCPDLRGQGIDMPMTITAVTEGRIHCGPWEFHRDTGQEIDEDLGWDGVIRTGSIIRSNGPNA